MGGSVHSMGLGVPAPPPGGMVGIHHGIEMLITRFSLDARCAQMLRMLPRDKQALAAELPVHEARNPSAFVMAQLQLPHFQVNLLPGVAMLGSRLSPPHPPVSSMFQVV